MYLQKDYNEFLHHHARRNINIYLSILT